MEDFEQKLSSGNVFLQTQALTKLQSKLLEASGDSSALYESEDLKKLWTTANHGSMSEATLAVETLLALVKEGKLPAPATLQNFLADVTSVVSPGVMVKGISELLVLMCLAQCEEGEDVECPFQGPPVGPIHPFVALINKKPEFMPTVLEEVSSLLYNSNPKIQRAGLKLIKPLVTYVLCLTEKKMEIASPMLGLLVEFHRIQPNIGIIPLLVDLVTLMKTKTNDQVERKIQVLCSLAQIAIEGGIEKLQAAVLPCLVMAIPLALEYNQGTRTVERHIITIAGRLGRGCDVTLCAVVEALSRTPGTLQVHLLKLATTLLTCKDGNPLIAARLLPSLLQVLSAPCTVVAGLTTAASALVSLIQAMPAQPTMNCVLADNEYWNTLSCAFPTNITFLTAIQFCDRLIKDPQLACDWLVQLSTSPIQLPSFHHSLVTALFLYQGSTSVTAQEALKVLEREVMKQKNYCLEVFPMVLYRLGREQDPITRLTLLYTLPSLAVNKLCVVLVLKTLLALWTSSSLRPIVLRLVFDLWTVEPRTFMYLMQLIKDKSIDTKELQIARAFVIASICKAEPQQHGEELLPILSSILNECRTVEGTGPTMLALDGIQELCANQVIDLRTTWKVIAPKLQRDRRPQVTIKLCSLLGLVPKLKISSKEYETFTKETLSMLWTYAIRHTNNQVVKAAYRSIALYPIDAQLLKFLPPYARMGIKLPASMAATPFEAARKPEDVLTYVPGLAWTKLILGCPEEHLDYVEDFMKALVALEVAGLPKGVYLTAVQEAKRKGVKGKGGLQPEPVNYSFLGESSAVKALVEFLMNFPKYVGEANTEKEVFRLVNTVVVALSAIGQPLDRPYPALDWSFLSSVRLTVETCELGEEGTQWTTRIRHGIIRIAAQQCAKSSSSLQLLTPYITPAPMNGLTRQDELVLFGLLDRMGRGVPPGTLQPFITYILNQHLNDWQHLKLLLEAIRPNLMADFIHDTNRAVLSNAVEHLNDKMDPFNEELYSAYKSCVADMPMANIERLTSPSLWWEITDEKLYRAAVLRCHVAAKDPEAKALPWLNDIVDAAASLPGDRGKFLEVMGEAVAQRSNIEESSSWLLQLLGRLRDQLKNEPGDNLVAAHEHNQRVSFYLDMLAVCLLIWSGLATTFSLEQVTKSPKTRGALLLPALVTMADLPVWENALQQVLNCLLSCAKSLKNQDNLPYQIGHCILLLAAIFIKLPQTLWVKVCVTNLS